MSTDRSLTDVDIEYPYALDIGDGVAIHDITTLFEQHPVKRYRTRKKPPTALFIHHSGADNGKDGLSAWNAVARYHVVSKGWPGIAYHFGINLRPDYDLMGRRIVYRLNSDDTCCYHTKGCNRFGVGLCLQGHHGNEPLSDFQLECLGPFLKWWFRTYGRDPKKDLGWHSNSWKWGGFPKPACPGKYSVRVLKEWLAIASEIP